MKTILTLLVGIALVALATPSNAQTTVADSVALKPYTGSYTFESGSPIQKFTLTADKGELYGEADSYGKNKLLKQDKADTFKSTSSYGSVITFIWDAATKAVTGFSMAIEGSTLTAKKD
ncbi:MULTISPECIES: DUF3471 domain-containing protein [unclassified Spirosoma]|uniref:DUF3471 domain-containing protein n=1 Tax=unclassified Spirosoma TaxID=2621999 RepID=UPI00095E1163|nr:MULTISPECIES: DUF3471 domain-containing protein [unclassified Spirosoma]MBN8825279.1 DUF3471 domain-containing protein [Spirosoma sp.]OJW77547.1 MAG: DUF3471 domain-containing protein [Spirosoma sp. 48-14]